MEFLIENLGIDNSDTFPGYGLGPNSPYTDCVYGIGDTEQEALENALDEMAGELYDYEDELADKIIAAFPSTTTKTVAEELGLSESQDCYYYVGIKWRA